MRRDELAHILRSAARIAEDNEVFVIGSQSILGTYDEDELPDEAISSMEADVAFFTDPDNAKSDAVDGAIGEGSAFHQMYGYYAQGVDVRTAVLPGGWRERLVVYASESSKPAVGVCLEPHDLAIAKLAAGREKDFAFVWALLQAHLLDGALLLVRADALEEPMLSRSVSRWLEAARRRLQRGNGEV